METESQPFGLPGWVPKDGLNFLRNLLMILRSFCILATKAIKTLKPDSRDETLHLEKERGEKWPNNSGSTRTHGRSCFAE